MPGGSRLRGVGLPGRAADFRQRCRRFDAQARSEHRQNHIELGPRNQSGAPNSRAARCGSIIVLNSPRNGDLDLPELTRLRVEQELTAYCERKVPLHVRDQVRLAFDLKGTHITLLEERAPLVTAPNGRACRSPNSGSTPRRRVDAVLPGPPRALAAVSLCRAGEAIALLHASTRIKLGSSGVGCALTSATGPADESLADHRGCCWWSLDWLACPGFLGPPAWRFLH